MGPRSDRSVPCVPAVPTGTGVEPVPLGPSSPLTKTSKKDDGHSQTIDHSDHRTKQLDRISSGYSGRLLLLVGAGSLTIHLGWFVLPALLPTVIEDLRITATQGGLALSLLTFVAALSRYPGGRLADQLSRKTMIAFSLTTAMAGFAVLASATNYTTLLAGVALAGVGLGTYVPAGVAQISDLFERKQGRAFGLNNAASSVGGRPRVRSCHCRPGDRSVAACVCPPRSGTRHAVITPAPLER